MTDIDKVFVLSVLIKSLKIAGAALVAVLFCNLLNLQSSVAAGIITVLSIGNTKRETFRSAINRGLAFLCAIGISFLCFKLIGYNIWAFSIYLFIFSLVCLVCKWPEAIAMDSVLITHFLGAGQMSGALLLNESLLFIVGTLMGIIVNLHLHPKSTDFDKAAEKVDGEIKQIISRMSRNILLTDKTEYDGKCFEKLDKSLDVAENCARINRLNKIWNNNFYEEEYVQMRRRQYYVLQQIYQNIMRLKTIPGQTEKVAEILDRIQSEYHRQNNVKSLLGELEQCVQSMKQQNLPVSREEFEDRAILFCILKQLELLLKIKSDFVKSNQF